MTFQPELLSKKLDDARRTNKSLADAVGVEPRTVSRWLKGVSTPRKRHVEAMAVAFGCSPDEFDRNFVDRKPNEAGISAVISVASHNAYELMRLRYGVSQKEIIELAPVLFSIVAGQALRVPYEDEQFLAKAEQYDNLYVSTGRNEEEQEGFERDRKAAAAGTCFGFLPPQGRDSCGRNLFRTAINRLCHDWPSISVRERDTYRPGEAPTASGYNVDVEWVERLTGGARDLAEAITSGVIRLSKCTEEIQGIGERGPESYPEVLRAELNSYLDERRQKRARWQARYEESHPDEAEEYGRLAEQICYPEDRHPDGALVDDAGAAFQDPFFPGERRIDPTRLPEYDSSKAENNHLYSAMILSSSATAQRFWDLQMLRFRSISEFDDEEK